MASHVNPADSLGFALKRLQQALRSRMDAGLAEHGLTSPQYAVLALLAEHPNTSNAELARRSYVTAPTMIRIITTLSEAGLITRAERIAEERVRRLTLTAAGEVRLAASADHVQHLEDLLAGHAGPEHTGTIMAWLRACADDLDRLPAAPDTGPSR